MTDAHLEWGTLNDFADGRLGPAEHAAAERHLRACAECQATEARLRRLVHDAESMDASIAPPDDLWGEVRASIGSQRSAAPELTLASQATPFPAGRAERRTLSGGWLAAAGLVLAALSSGITALVLTRGSTTGQVAEAPARRERRESGASRAVDVVEGGASSATPVPRAGATLARDALPASFAASERSYRTSVADLEVLFERRRRALAPSTVQLIERSLATIDVAIAEMRAALVADPANADLTRMLNASYGQKLDLLRRASDFSAS
ncbi:MAG: zf-HC2 domain-containing protein [Gemmatimonadaceae bacterium]